MKAIHQITTLLLIALAGCASASGITFTFGNVRVTGAAPQILEFDVLAQASENGTYIGDTQVYINYNTSGFGTSIATNNKVEVTKGSLISGEIFEGSGIDKYTIVSLVDNTPSRLAVALELTIANNTQYANPLTTTPQALLHLAIEIANPLLSAGLSFEQALMAGQIYQYDLNLYNPVVASDENDSSLPVRLGSFAAERRAHGVELAWRTESEIDNLGFNLYRSDDENGDWEKINGSLIPGAGHSTQPLDYSFLDHRVENNRTYFYRLEDLSISGVRQLHEPVRIDVQTYVPDTFVLEQNYPNPFNPETTIGYGLPEESRVTLDIHNLRGERVIRLVDDVQPAGIHAAVWSARSFEGTRLASGVYFYTLVANGFRLTGKMVLSR
ncbi:T9SS type A sorting domain-containing protein [candidate division KSB1 bacterium]|nr:T9SS type A sorting domain-containing protein [candidate division KSB1 bacterium]